MYKDIATFKVCAVHVTFHLLLQRLHVDVAAVTNAIATEEHVCTMVHVVTSFDIKFQCNLFCITYTCLVHTHTLPTLTCIPPPHTHTDQE